MSSEVGVAAATRVVVAPLGAAAEAAAGEAPLAGVAA